LLIMTGAAGAWEGGLERRSRDLDRVVTTVRCDRSGTKYDS